MKIQRSLRPRLTFANVVAMVCLCVVVGGSGMPTAAAARLFGSEDISNNSLRGVDIRDNSVRWRRHCATTACGVSTSATAPSPAPT